MTDTRNLRSGRMKAKGPLHERLHRVLQAKWRAGEITQESLANAIGKSQENVGQYLRATKAGALSLDEAASALEHVGSSIRDFLADVPPRERTRAERLANALESRPTLMQLAEDLLVVPRTRLPAVSALARELLLPAIGRPATAADEARTAPTKGRRTTKAPRRRR